MSSLAAAELLPGWNTIFWWVSTTKRLEQLEELVFMSTQVKCRQLTLNACNLCQVTTIVETVSFLIKQLQPKAKRGIRQMLQKSEYQSWKKIHAAGRGWVGISARKTQSSWWKSYFLPQCRASLIGISKQRSDCTPKRYLSSFCLWRFFVAASAEIKGSAFKILPICCAVIVPAMANT